MKAIIQNNKLILNSKETFKKGMKVVYKKDGGPGKILEIIGDKAKVEWKNYDKITTVSLSSLEADDYGG